MTNKKKIFKLIIFYFCFFNLFTVNISYADNQTVDYYNSQAKSFYEQNKYTDSILTYKKSLREQYANHQALVGIINSYLARATYFYNKKQDLQSSANDLRSALFYLKYYSDITFSKNIDRAIDDTQLNLSEVLELQKINLSSQNRFNIAKNLRQKGEFAASAVEFLYALQGNISQDLEYEASLNLGDIMSIFENYSQSAFFYDRAFNLNQNDPKLALKLARSYEKSNQFDKAQQYYNTALSKNIESNDVLDSLYRIYSSKYNSDPKNVENCISFGAICQKLNYNDKALNLYKKAQDLDPKNQIAKLNLATLYQLQKNYDSAIKIYDDILNKNSNNVRARLYKAQCLNALNKYNEALAEYKLVLVNDPDNKEAKLEYFELMKSKMPSDKFISYLQEQVVKNPNDELFNYNLAFELHRLGNINEAIPFYKKTIELNSTNQDAYINLASIYREIGQMDEALNVMNKAKVKFANNPDIDKYYKEFQDGQKDELLNQAMMAFEANKFQDALSIYQKIQPASFDSISGMGSTYYALGNLKEALNYYKKAFSLKPNDSDINYLLALTYSDLEDINNAAVYAKKAMELNPQNNDAKELYDYISKSQDDRTLKNIISLYDNKQYTTAISRLNQYLNSGKATTSKKSSLAYYYRGLCYEALNNQSLAIKDYQMTIKLDPNVNIAYYSLAVGYDSLKQYKNALTYYRLYLSKEKNQNEFTGYSKTRIEELKNYG